MKPKINPQGPQSGLARVIRGGSWYDGARFLRSAVRDFFDPGHRNFGLGFRLVRKANNGDEIDLEKGFQPVSQSGEK
jgi:formylglycine-generating enzyme required for sulfatase activity